MIFVKKLITLSLVIFLAASSMQAHGWGGYRGGGHYYRGWGYGGWMAPFMLGGVVGYAVSRPTVIYDASPTVIYTTPPQTMIVQDRSSPSVVQETTNVSTPAPVYEERWVYFEDCQCERKVLVNIQP